MKRIFLLLSLPVALQINQLQAQTQLPNADMENWTTAANGTDSLIGWSSGNAVAMTPVESLVQTTDAHHGTKAAMVITAPFGFVQYTTIGVLVNGNATFSYGGGGNTDNVVHTGGGGTPISYKPEAVNGYFKYETLAVDHGIGIAYLSKYNTTTQQRDTVSYGEMAFNPQAAYTSFSIPLTDIMPGVMPDSITTIFYSSDSATVPQFGVFSTLFLDSLTFSPAGPTSIPGIEENSMVLSVSPNPNNGVFTITNRQRKELTIGVYDAIGKRVKSIRLPKEKQELMVDMHELSAGTYFLKAEDNTGWKQKVIIVR